MFVKIQRAAANSYGGVVETVYEANRFSIDLELGDHVDISIFRGNHGQEERLKLRLTKGHDEVWIMSGEGKTIDHYEWIPASFIDAQRADKVSGPDKPIDETGSK
ncbi:MAG: hypothetical protein GWO24_31070 [Akkermansiaceae bacterium]|nr:hypothetical protein [Akkermansiaceae bacterium]NIS11206.1 hypothetical protein [Thermoplasmata archaeon]NIS19144.1 hypothetical protein [Thermoplasmata archaeon]NIT76200.1 hypothetical protein [Thermoplasmata archaeon]NIY02571.1 hypothetical protein [Thermoplasmata archaeon]